MRFTTTIGNPIGSQKPNNILRKIDNSFETTVLNERAQKSWNTSTNPI